MLVEIMMDQINPEYWRSAADNDSAKLREALKDLKKNPHRGYEKEKSEIMHIMVRKERRESK